MPRQVAGPIERFLHRETASASLLVLAALVALLWSNLAAGSYEGFWSTKVTVELGPLLFEEDLPHLVNDLLMAVFFYVVALEVKRELLFGSLRQVRSAVVPVAAAVGTMVGGSLVYLAVNLDGGDLRGWAIPMATDIAFALGALGLVGSRAPRQLRAFLLTLAVVDDLAAIAIIAIFFAQGVSPAWLAAAAGLALAVAVLRRLGIRLRIAYALLAGLLWLATFESGVHPTIAGVVLGFLTPAVAVRRRRKSGKPIAARLRGRPTANARASEPAPPASPSALRAASPLTRMEERLHPWSAYVILPLFALANAGVTVSLPGIADALTSPVGLGVALGLAIGAPLGGLLFAWAPVRLGLARLPDGLDWAAIGGVAPLKGIGFTVAIFISVLAFDEEALREEAKLAILTGSALAAATGLCVLYARHLILSRRGPASFR